LVAAVQSGDLAAG
jgi:transposase